MAYMIFQSYYLYSFHLNHKKSVNKIAKTAINWGKEYQNLKLLLGDFKVNLFLLDND